MQATLVGSNIAIEAWERPISELDDIDGIVRTYRPRLLRFVTFTTGDQDLAETITQDSFLRAYQARHTFRGDCSVMTWLTSIAINLIRDHHRTQKFRFWKKVQTTALDVTEMASILADARSSQETQLLAREQALQIAAALETLSTNQRSIFLMKFAEEMDVSEISLAIGMPVNTVKTHLHRAIKAIRAKVGESR